VGLDGSFEWEWGKNTETQLGSFTYELGLSSGITLPKIVAPAGWTKSIPFSLQQTSVNLDVRLLNRTAYYQMASIMTNLNYNWGISHNIQHSFSPVYLNQVRLLQTTADFDSVVNDNIYIRKSFEEQFILGMRYNFTYDNTYRIRPHNFFLQTSVNTSGGVMGLVKSIGNEEEERPWTVLNSVYSQFLKITTDVRYYRNWRDHRALVFRFYSGIGLPYRNSTVLPYVEQFFSGGAYSIRGFAARYLGPGSYYEEKSGYIDQSGDIKLEANMEYRFSLSKILKAAFFLETGNIWLINEDENRPGARFDIHEFYKELAVGTGVGLRLDFDFFVLRTDFGFPLRNPYQTDGRNWLFGTGDILSGMLFYLAIGYPF
jgi:outer membrane protein assembly factor BamA